MFEEFLSGAVHPINSFEITQTNSRRSTDDDFQRINHPFQLHSVDGSSYFLAVTPLAHVESGNKLAPDAADSKALMRRRERCWCIIFIKSILPKCVLVSLYTYRREEKRRKTEPECAISQIHEEQKINVMMMRRIDRTCFPFFFP